MSGNSHQRKKSKKAKPEPLRTETADSSVTHLSETMQKRTAGISTDRLIAIIALASGFALAVMGLPALFPIVISVPIYCVALICILIGGWKWKTAAMLGRRGKAFCGLLVVLIYAAVFAYPVQKQYEREIVAITFKDSPFFNFYRRQVIRRDITRMRDYLANLGIPTREEIPPFGVNTRPDAGECEESGISPTPLILSTLSIGKQYVTDRKAATCAYLTYAVNDRTIVIAESSPDPQTNKININNIVINALLSGTLVSYFNYSFWDTTPPAKDLAGWIYVLWTFRDRFGKKFADRLVANLLQLVSMDKGQMNETPGAYFARKLKLADNAVDNEATKWPEIQKILKSTGWE